MDLIPYALPPRVSHEIARFRPELVYSCLGSIQVGTLAVRLARVFDIPVVPHFMDDWVSTLYVKKASLTLHRWLLRQMISSVVQRAGCGLAISDAMAQEYASIFGLPFETFMNCVQVSASMPRYDAPAQSDELRLVYVGGLHLKRWQSLREIAQALEALIGKGIRARLDIYSPARDVDCYGSHLAVPSVRLAGPLRQDEVLDTLQRSDVLVHVESFDNPSRVYTRLSVSTKIPQYMSVGRPLFCYGPGEIASCRYVESAHCGIVVGSQNGTAMIEGLHRLCSDQDLRRQLGGMAWHTARVRHDAAVVREKFRFVLAQEVRRKAAAQRLQRVESATSK